MWQDILWQYLALGDGPRANVTASDRTVTFSDGTVLDVPAGEVVATGAQSFSGGGTP